MVERRPARHQRSIVEGDDSDLVRGRNLGDRRPGRCLRRRESRRVGHAVGRIERNDRDRPSDKARPDKRPREREGEQHQCPHTEGQQQ